MLPHSRLTATGFAVCLGLGAGLLGHRSPAAAASQEYHAPQVRLPLFTTAPVIDGKVDGKEWAGAARMEGLGYGPQLAPLAVSFWVGCDGKELFVAMVSETPPGGKLLARFNPLPGNGDARTWLDDSIELVFDPLRTAAAGVRKLYHANLNAKNAIHDTAYTVGGSAEAWRGNWRLASQIVGDRWYFEAALPLQDMGVTAADLRGPFGVRIVRNWQQTPLASQTEWSPLAGAFLNPETMPVVTWDAAAPVVQMLQLAEPGKPGAHLKLGIGNPGAAPLELKALLRLAPTSSAPRELNQTVTVAPGETKLIELSQSVMNEDLYSLIQVSSADGKTVYYLRDFLWRPERPENVWSLDETALRKIQTQFAYYPSFNKIHFKADINGLEQKDQVQALAVELRRKGETKPLAATAMPPLKDYSSRLLWEVPALAEGEYELVMRLSGVKMDPVVQPFVRHVFPWEHNKLGKSDVVLEGFAPLAVKGKTLSTVLRQHQLNDLGLWDQVISLDQPLLQGAMRLEVTTGGKLVEAKGKQLKFSETKATRAVTRGAWTAGTASGTTRGEWDYDGMQKWTLEIAPGPQPIEAMTLVIPLADGKMPLFHACTDGIRFNYAGSTPAGQGSVWNGSKAARNSIIGSYVPYIWLGAEERGLAVFGENDRGWVSADKVPCQELVRNGAALELRLNLIAKPVTITEPRRILIGFQATPVKPLPANWRLWVESYATQVPPAGKRITFLGSCWYWGTLTPCLDLYPRNEDLTLWDEFAKTRKTNVISQEFVEKWLAVWPTKQTAAEKQNIRAHVSAGFNSMTGHPTDILVYTNARGVRFDTPEGQTFLDEWHRDAFSTRVWPLGGGVAYDLNPGESFRDYAMWYYKKMYDTFVDHIYWDNIFLQSCFDVVGTEAYELPDGSIQPAAGLFDMRELVRRAAILYHEQGRTDRAAQEHMTNTAIVPILAFAGTHLTWEDRAGDTDFQDRFSRDYIRAESIGRQCGNVPFALMLINGPDTDKLAWAKRTMAGVCLTHEIRPIGPLDDYEKSIKLLYDYGYGQPEVKVCNYWQEQLPVTVSRPDTSFLIVSKPGSALVAVCDYANGGDVVLSPDLAALGIVGKLAATDSESGQPVEVTADGKVKFSLKKHDFRLLRLEGKP